MELQSHTQWQQHLQRVPLQSPHGPHETISNTPCSVPPQQLNAAADVRLPAVIQLAAFSAATLKDFEGHDDTEAQQQYG